MPPRDSDYLAAGAVAVALLILIAVVIAVSSVHVAILLLATFAVLLGTLQLLQSRRAAKRIDDLGVRVSRHNRRNAAHWKSAQSAMHQILQRIEASDADTAARFDSLSRRLNESTGSLLGTISGVNGVQGEARRHSAQANDRLKEIERHAAAAGSGVRRLEQGAHSLDLRRHVVGDVAAVLALRSREKSTALPLWSDWGLAPQVLLELVKLVSTAAADSVVVELGSGDSTLWIAQTLADRGDGRLISFEHDEAYARRTSRRLIDAGLAEWVELRVAPLQDVEIDGQSYRWYSQFEDLSRIDIMVVDGPPGGTGRHARFPALPLLLPALAEGAVVLLDDVDRADEQDILARWTTRSDDTRTMRVDRFVDRAALLVVQRST